MQRRRKRPRILICTPEITELPEGMGNAAHTIRAKGGGLGDISAGLIRYLHEDERFELHVVLPKYDAKFRDFANVTARELDLLVPLLQRKGVHLVSDSAFSNLHAVYEENSAHPRVRRAEAFQRYIINQLLDELRPDVVHCNDWMTGLVPAAAREKGIKSIFTLHNVFTEYDSPSAIDRMGIDVRRFMAHLYMADYPEAWRDNWNGNRVDFTASGIHAADVVNTVSPTFLYELVRGEFGNIVPPSVRAAIRIKDDNGRALGILNAPSDTVDPRLSKHISAYDETDVMEKKAVNKTAFQERMGLRQEAQAPLFLWPSRLYDQKGPDLLLAIAKRIIDHHGGQIAIVANGEPDMERKFQKLALASQGRVSQRYFREDLSELGKAGSDFVLMPSLYEPCGLPQMEGPRYGTLPVVRATGGLSDTVLPLDIDLDTGIGFVFEEFSAEAFEGAIARAVEFHRLPYDTRRRTLERIMKESFDRFSLANTAKQYIRVYESFLE
jgi:starch synthase